jgi:DNA end-binding protein Ku
MPNAIWSGSLSLGLVVMPVRLYPAIRKKVVRFHELDGRGRRVRHIRVSEPEVDFEGPGWEPARPALDMPPPPPPPSRFVHSEPAPVSSTASQEIRYEEIRKGYEVAPGQYVSLTREEVAALGPERSRVIDVEQFVDASAIDPIYFESRYYVAPDRGSVMPFRLLAHALSDAKKAAIGWITLRQRRYLSAIRPYGDVMLLTTMVHADEVLPADFWITDTAAAPTERELKMARLLIDTLSGPFEPDRFADEHRRRVLNAIEEKTPLKADAHEAPSPTRVLDLMAALQASVKAAKAAKANQVQRSSGTRKHRGA